MHATVWQLINNQAPYNVTRDMKEIHCGHNDFPKILLSQARTELGSKLIALAPDVTVKSISYFLPGEKTLFSFQGNRVLVYAFA